MPLAENFVRMGVTTLVAGNCGGSAVDVAEALQAIERTGVSINFATLVGHNSVRQRVLGTSAASAYRPRNSSRMRDLWPRAMAAGAVGLSTGLEYVPGTYATRRRDRRAGQGRPRRPAVSTRRICATKAHRWTQAIAEAIAIGEAAGCPVQISHLKIDSPSVWGRAPQLLALIDGARARGVRVRADQYAYTAASTGLGIRFPSWVFEGGEEAVRRHGCRRRGRGRGSRVTCARCWREMGASDYAFAVVASYPSGSGTQRALDCRDRQAHARRRQRSTRSSRLHARCCLSGGAQMVYHVMGDADVARIMRHPQVAVASDASLNTPGVGRPHPRSYGNTVRVLAKYVRRRPRAHAWRGGAQDEQRFRPSTSASPIAGPCGPAWPPTSSSSIPRPSRIGRRSRSRTRFQPACRTSWSTAPSSSATAGTPASDRAVSSG